MKKIILIGIILCITTMALCGCHKPVVTVVDEYGVKWGVVHSPITGNYYEVAQIDGLFTTKAGMAKIFQHEYERFLLENK